MSPLALCCDSLPMNLVLFLFQVGSLPSTAPTDYAFSQPSFPVFPLSLPYSGVLHILPLFPAPTASVFCKLIHTCFHALMRYSNSISIPIIVTSPNLFLLSPPNIRSSHVRSSNRFRYITVPRSCSPSLEFYDVVRQQQRVLGIL